MINVNDRTKMMVMVKAFAYGSGNFEISNALEFHHADYLTVAYADEGIELRKKGINLPIMVMAPELNTFESIIKNNLEPVIYSFRSLSLLEDAIDKISFYLEHDNIREEIANRGRKKTLEQHSLQSRLEEIFRIAQI